MNKHVSSSGSSSSSSSSSSFLNDVSQHVQGQTGTIRAIGHFKLVGYIHGYIAQQPQVSSISN